MKRILVLRFGSLGDVILTSPTLLNIRLQYPKSHITYLTKANFTPIVEQFSSVDNVVGLPSPTSAQELFSTIRELQKNDYDVVIDLHGTMRSWLVQNFVFAQRKLTYPKRAFERFAIVQGRHRPSSWPHAIDLYNQPLNEAGIGCPARRPLMDVDVSVLPEAVSELRIKHGALVTIAPGAAHPTKQYPVERFAEVAEILYEKYHVGVIWAVTSHMADDLDLSEYLPASAYLRLVDASLNVLGTTISRCRLTIGNDSGVSHLSSAVGTPVVAVFGPTHPSLGFMPAGLFDQIADVNEDCRPCSPHGKKVCYRDKQYCFDRLKPVRIAHIAGGIMESDIKSKRALFIDRDGTIIKDKHFLSDPNQIEILPGVVEALRKAKRLGLTIVVVSNQSGVARSLMGIDDVHAVNSRLVKILADESVEIDAVYICPHHLEGSNKEYAIRCNCRKPSPGMAETAAMQLGVDLRRSYVVGDKVDDYNLGLVIGATPFLVKTGYGVEYIDLLPKLNDGCEPRIAENLLHAVDEIEKLEQNG